MVYAICLRVELILLLLLAIVVLQTDKMMSGSGDDCGIIIRIIIYDLYKKNMK